MSQLIGVICECSRIALIHGKYKKTLPYLPHLILACVFVSALLSNRDANDELQKIMSPFIQLFRA